MASKLPVPVILFLLSYFLCAVCEEKPTGYDTKYDNIDLTELLKNDRLRKNYVKCLLDEGPCSPDGQELKNSIPDAIATDCSKCSGKQKNGSETVTHYLIDNQPDEWDQLAKLYDKDGEYKRKYLETKQTSTERQINDAIDENGAKNESVKSDENSKE